MADLIRRKQAGEAWETAVEASGGAAPVGCVFGFAQADLQPFGDHDLAPNAIGDNEWDFNSIPLPAGLGISVTADGASPSFTTLEAGTWAFVFEAGQAADATWLGQATIHGVDNSLWFSGDLTHGWKVSKSGVWQLPEGVEFTFRVTTQVAATTTPFSLQSAIASVVRLG